MTNVPIVCQMFSFKNLFSFFFFIYLSGIDCAPAYRMQKKLPPERRLEAEIRSRQKNTTSCDLFLAPSLLPGAGLGIIAGKPYKSNEAVETIGPAVLINREQSSDTMLHNFVYSSSWPEYAVTLFGIGMMMNHMPNGDVKK